MIKDYEMLLSPGNIGGMGMKNRIVMPPMVRSYATPDGIATRKLIDHYAARARGGIGLAIVEATYVHPSGKLTTRQLGIHHEKCVPGLGELADTVKEWGCKILVQLHHAGRQTTTAVTDMPVVAPSAIPCPVTGGFPVEMTTEEVVEMVEIFAQAAKRAKRAGFDGVEIHGAHGYLINQFLSPNTNRRTDKYGGDINGRATILLEIIKRTRELIGESFIITTRLNGRDQVPGGLELDESIQVARMLEAAGIDGLHITTGTSETRLNMSAIGAGASMYEPRGHIVNDAAQIKSAVSIPVIAVGSIKPETGEEILRQGKADFIAMGRALLADPELPNKLNRGEPESIRPCIRCMERCRRFATSISCTVNAQVGSESYGILPPLKQKKVLIVGGGVAGMEAARIAAIRGHQVNLYDKNEHLGGHLIEATVPDFKADLKEYKDWLIREIEKLPVKINLGTEITSKIVENEGPEVLIIATGSINRVPNLPGADGPNVTTAIDILLGKAQAGDKTIIIGGGAMGCEVAVYLAQQGNKVTVVEMLPQVVADVPNVRGALITGMSDNGVEVMTDMKAVGITVTGITAIDRGRNIVNINGDKVVLAIGLSSQKTLYDELKSKVREIYQVGDCIEPQRVGEAVRDGYRIGNIL